MSGPIVDTAAEFWAARICAAQAASVAAIIQTGRELVAAKAKLPRGEWGRLTGETTRAPLLPFSSQTAQRLMAIADNAVLANPAHWAGLPASWRTLAELARMPDDDLQKHLADGVIHPEMTRATVEDLLEELRLAGTSPRPSPPPPPPPPPGGDEREREADKGAFNFKEAARRARQQQQQQHQQRAHRGSTATPAGGRIVKADFKLILGCLHPDQQPDERKDRYTRAFQIFQKLEALIVGKGGAA